MKRLALLLLAALLVAIATSSTPSTPAQAATPTPTAADVTVGSPISVNYGQIFRFQSYTCDMNAGVVSAIWQTSVNATNATGRFFSVRVGPNSTVYTFSDGTASLDTTLKFSNAGVQATCPLAAVQAFGATHAR
jgi:hypothetical protein